MSSILDIDLGYFKLNITAAQRLAELLAWADCPVSFVVENHHESLHRWISYVKGKEVYASYGTFCMSMNVPT